MRATLTTHSHLQFNTLSLREVTVTLQQQQTPGIFRQMFHKTTKTATNAGDYPANVPKKGHCSNKLRRKNSRKCSTITQIQQQTPGIFRQMFHNYANSATNAGEKTPANVTKNHQNSNKHRRLSGKCSKKPPKRSRSMRSLRNSRWKPPDFQLKRASAPSCLRALNRSTQAGRRANTGK